jgi:hypothetical protein
MCMFYKIYYTNVMTGNRESTFVDADSPNDALKKFDLDRLSLSAQPPFDVLRTDRWEDSIAQASIKAGERWEKNAKCINCGKGIKKRI